jgi:hypothetical protein
VRSRICMRVADGAQYVMFLTVPGPPISTPIACPPSTRTRVGRDDDRVVRLGEAVRLLSTRPSTAGRTGDAHLVSIAPSTSAQTLYSTTWCQLPSRTTRNTRTRSLPYRAAASRPGAGAPAGAACGGATSVIAGVGGWGFGVAGSARRGRCAAQSERVR